MTSRLRCAFAALLAASVVTGGLLGCDGVPEPAPLSPEAGTSPNASILPAPLATEAPDILDAGADAAAPVDASAKSLASDASAPSPTLPRPDLALSAETPISRELAGVTLEAVWRWRDVPPPAKVAEAHAPGIRAVVEASRHLWKIDVAEVGRLRIELVSRAFVLPKRTELRAIAERYGHIVLWPNATDYRVVSPGALRPLLGERRNDVTPLVLLPGTPAGPGATIVGLPTRRVELGSSLGTLKIDLAKAPESGQGAALLCRSLVEIAGVDPKTPLCQNGELPLAATYAWRGGGGISFEVTSLTRRIDLAYNDMLAPPPGAAFAEGGLPAVPDGILVTREELAAFRTGPAEVAPNPSAPGEGFIAENRSDLLLYLLVDGAPVVLVPPGKERYLVGTQRGRYGIAWRSFLGDRIDDVGTVELPARIVYGAPLDAGAPDGG